MSLKVQVRILFQSSFSLSGGAAIHSLTRGSITFARKYALYYNLRAFKPPTLVLIYRKEVERTSAMAEDALREVAATDEPSSVPGKHGVGSYELFFLLQRIDCLDEKMSNQNTSIESRLTNRIESLDGRVTGDIKAVATDLKSLDEKLSRQIDNINNSLDNKIQNLDSNLTGAIRSLDSTLTGEIRALNTKLTGKIRAKSKA